MPQDKQKIVSIREPKLEDRQAFLKAMQASRALHYPWVRVPLTAEEFVGFYQWSLQPDQKSFLVCDQEGHIAGVFNISEIVRGLFQNAYLGFYSVHDYVHQGYMSAGLKLVLEKVFKNLKLHRIEANIQPDNLPSKQLVKRNGFRYEGYSPRYLEINGEWRGHEHWAMTVEDFIHNDPEILQKDHVDIVAYHSDWPLLAKTEIQKIKTTLPFKIIAIEHVGSTAIPEMSAKPIIDIQIAVSSLDEIKALAIPELQKLGYEYWDENPDPTRMFFVKGMPPYGEKRTHHVHIVELDSKHWRDKITFRDYLRTHPEVAKEYMELKNKLAKQYTYDREKYTDAKAEFINKILKSV